MKLGGAHLTYCTNIHPGETWSEVRANVERYVAAVKAAVSPAESFGVGLRLSGRAAHELAAPGELAAFRSLLDRHGLYVFTINGFPHGAFHAKPVKAEVYRPDWLEPERVVYTNVLADLLVELLPEGVGGSISTVPGCFRPRATSDAGAVIAANLTRCTDHLAALEHRTGKHVTLALEPEPCCSIETLAEAVEFFATHRLDRRYLGVCLDACHAAVEFEDLEPALDALHTAGIAIAKLQLSAGLRVAPVDDEQRRWLERWVEPVYLHQVVARRGDRLVRYVDLPEALAAARVDVDERSEETGGGPPTGSAGRGGGAPRGIDDEWRVHFHVPIFHGERATQDYLAELLASHRGRPISTHLEVETYTWDVLPARFRERTSIVDAIARELRWVIERLR